MTAAPDTTPLVPVHTEAVVDDPTSLRWVAPVGNLGFVGTPSRMPSALTSLLADATLAEVALTASAVVTRLGPGHTWRAEGGRVRDAVQAALADPDGWAAPEGASPDDALRMAVVEVIAGDVGDYVRSHGAQIELVAVGEGSVEVQMSGACSHCPAADITLSGRFETALRALHPGVREVRARVGGSELPTGARRLPLHLLRR
ncbi:MAG: NifU family protein [Actinomycetota bacterium]|nr:NifU family protein [Actinomycetota bacterium]